MISIQSLPAEPWFEIFSIALSVTIQPSAFNSNLFSLHDEPRLVSWRHAQHKRNSLLTLCKHLHPLVKQIIFTDVILYGNRSYSRYVDQARRPTPTGRKDGEWTRTLRLYSISPTSLEKLISICPNLGPLEIGFRSNIGITGQPSRGISFSSLHYLMSTNPSLLWSDLRLIAERCLHLLQLGLISCEIRKCEGTITFPSLQRFTASNLSTERFDLLLLAMPSLRPVRLEIGTAKRVASFFKSRGPT